MSDASTFVYSTVIAPISTAASMSSMMDKVSSDYVEKSAGRSGIFSAILKYPLSQMQAYVAKQGSCSSAFSQYRSAVSL